MNQHVQKKHSSDMDELNDLLWQRWMSGIWTVDPEARPREPRTQVKPHLWKWDEVYDGMLQARERIDVSRGKNVERRAIRLVNPGLQDTARTTQSMVFTVQILNPGEVAPPHRHSMAALRFILQGKGAYTIVEGEKFIMEAGDLILTPQGTWHEHANEGTEPMIWIDGLDVPLIESLQVVYMEPYEGKGIPLKEHASAASDYGVMRPVAAPETKPSAPLHYRWRDVYPALQRRAEAEPHPFDGVALEYVNPVTGGPTLPTLSCWLQMLRPGQRTQVHRHTSTTLYHAFRGSGTTIVNGEAINWNEGDTFVVPLWSWHEHANNTSSDEAVLFSMHDTPVLNAFGLYREESRGPSHLGL